ncbi:putative VHS domain-containing protein [Helianthus annuus]|nr:putative VHS domain-containing protein [Helianthus annuus]
MVFFGINLMTLCDVSSMKLLDMAAELVNAATSDKLTEMDWTKSIEICELVARDHR